jgi:hypothetical protein
VLRSLHLEFDSKFYVSEEMKDLEKLMMDELHAIPTAHEMRIEKQKPTWKETTFKASKKTK